MTLIDSRPMSCPVCRCSIPAVCQGPEHGNSERSEITHDGTATPGGPRQSSELCSKVGTKEGVHNVHTFGFGSSRTSVGSGRIAYISGSSQS